MKEMTYDELKAVSDKLLAMPRPGEYEKSQRADFLMKAFSRNTEDFCCFLGHMRVLLENKKIRKVDVISLFDDIAMAALNIGRDAGRYSGIKDYGGPMYQFLLDEKDKKATA